MQKVVRFGAYLCVMVLLSALYLEISNSDPMQTHKPTLRPPPQWPRIRASARDRKGLLLQSQGRQALGPGDMHGTRTGQTTDAPSEPVLRHHSEKALSRLASDQQVANAAVAMGNAATDDGTRSVMIAATVAGAAQGTATNVGMAQSQWSPLGVDPGESAAAGACISPCDAEDNGTVTSTAKYVATAGRQVSLPTGGGASSSIASPVRNNTTECSSSKDDGLCKTSLGLRDVSQGHTVSQVLPSSHPVAPPDCFPENGSLSDYINLQAQRLHSAWANIGKDDVAADCLSTLSLFLNATDFAPAPNTSNVTRAAAAEPLSDCALAADALLATLVRYLHNTLSFRSLASRAKSSQIQQRMCRQMGHALLRFLATARRVVVAPAAEANDARFTCADDAWPKTCLHSYTTQLGRPVHDVEAQRLVGVLRVMQDITRRVQAVVAQNVTAVPLNMTRNGLKRGGEGGTEGAEVAWRQERSAEEEQLGAARFHLMHMRTRWTVDFGVSNSMTAKQRTPPPPPPPLRSNASAGLGGMPRGRSSTCGQRNNCPTLTC